MGKYRLIGHRGYSAKFKENTLKAFKEAFNKSNGIECDIQKTGDDKYVIIHNDFIEIEDRKHFLKDKFYSALKEIFPDLPLLEELIKICPDNKILNFEIKDDTIESSDLNNISKMFSTQNKDNIIISSFNNEFLKFFKKSGYSTGFLIGERHSKMKFSEILKLIKETDPDYINLPVQAFDEVGSFAVKFMIFVFRITGRKIIFWTINKSDELKKCRKYSSIIISDNPEEEVINNG